MKQVQTFMKDSSDHLSRALSRSRVVITAQDTDLRYVSVLNPDPGYEHTIGKRIEEFADPKDVAEIMALKELVRETKQPQQKIVKTKSNGETKTFDMTVTPMIENGKIIGYTTISVDISDLLAAQEELHQAQARLLGLIGDHVYGGSAVGAAKHKRRPA